MRPQCLSCAIYLGRAILGALAQTFGAQRCAPTSRVQSLWPKGVGRRYGAQGPGLKMLCPRRRTQTNGSKILGKTNSARGLGPTVGCQKRMARGFGPTALVPRPWARGVGFHLHPRSCVKGFGPRGWTRYRGWVTSLVHITNKTQKRGRL